MNHCYSNLQNMNNPEVVIIVPVYNSEIFLKKCLDSIKNQIFYSFVCFIIDDGSTDSSCTIASEYSSADDRFVLFHQENRGIAFTRSRGIELAKSTDAKYLLFVDSDDSIEPECLNNLISYADVN